MSDTALASPPPTDTRPGPLWHLLLLGAALTIGALVAVLTGFGETTREIPEGPRGTSTFEVESRDHVEEPVDYSVNPPIGGDHAPVWANCGVYTTAVPPELAVHSMEHGAVWVTYPPSLGTDAEAQLQQVVKKSFVGKERFIILSPMDGIDELTLSAWGRQLRVDSADDPRVVEFLDAFAGGEQAPEPGYPCSGGIGQPDE